ncbi:MAG: rhodanese-like domain-containing protein [Betaproteobacteria bacterium]|nr:rhodanese-like domain-containing protein [Betaproteobacteria bacterium]
MTEVEEILATATERGRAKNLPYAGEVTPQEAHRLATAHGAIIVDVRSAAETNFVGRVPGSKLIEWKYWPSGDFNPQFLPELKRQCGQDDIVLFLCRSAVRSHAAATTATEAGFNRAFNILEGFEGTLDAHDQRGQHSGWRKAGLPWTQS